MRNATLNSLAGLVKQCERDIEEVQRRLSAMKGKIIAMKEVGTESASRDAQAARMYAREAGARVPINLNSINIKGRGVYGEKVADATARAPGISLGFMFRNLTQAIPHHLFKVTLTHRDHAFNRMKCRAPHSAPPSSPLPLKRSSNSAIASINAS